MRGRESWGGRESRQTWTTRPRRVLQNESSRRRRILRSGWTQCEDLAADTANAKFAVLSFFFSFFFLLYISNKHTRLPGKKCTCKRISLVLCLKGFQQAHEKRSVSSPREEVLRRYLPDNNCTIPAPKKARYQKLRPDAQHAKRTHRCVIQQGQRVLCCFTCTFSKRENTKKIQAKAVVGGYSWLTRRVYRGVVGRQPAGAKLPHTTEYISTYLHRSRFFSIFSCASGWQ